MFKQQPLRAPANKLHVPAHGDPRLNDLETLVSLLDRATRILRTAIRDARAGCAADAVLESVQAGEQDIAAAKRILGAQAAKAPARPPD